MNPNSRAFLQLPQGAESFYLEEAVEHEESVAALKGLFASWGYLPVQTPVFDFYDIYRPFLGRGAENTYRLIDREGELLLLRSDVTLFLAKQLGRLRGRVLPLRVFYADSILRHEDAEALSRNEFYQTGAELIGLPGAFADLEVLMLLVRSLERLGLGDYRIHLGSRSLFDAVFGAAREALGSSGASGEALRGVLEAASRAVSLREVDVLRALLVSLGYGPDRVEYLSGLFFYIGGLEGLGELVLRGRVGGFLDASMEASLVHLEGLWRELEELGVSRLFRIDLSETASQPYYTGVVFQAYREGIDSAFASGGRYDRLLSCFGFDAPAVGFSLMLRKVESCLRNFQVPQKRDCAVVRGLRFAEVFRKAEGLRSSSGRPVVMGEGANEGS